MFFKKKESRAGKILVEWKNGDRRIFTFKHKEPMKKFKEDLEDAPHKIEFIQLEDDGIIYYIRLTDVRFIVVDEEVN